MGAIKENKVERKDAARHEGDAARQDGDAARQDGNATKDGDRADLSTTEQREAEEQKRPRAAVIHEAVRSGGEEELNRTVSSLA